MVSIIPTGIGCDLGGYAGDAALATNLLAATSDFLVTNPNAVNASNFISMADNVLYTEGLCIDLFMKGLIDLRVPYGNRIGLVIEKSSPERLDLVFNVVNSIRAIYGVNIVDYVITDQPIGSHCVENESETFVGTVDSPDVIFDACERLIRKGVDAIAVTTNIQDLPPEITSSTSRGSIQPLGGVEAIISYLIVNRFQIPAAHAPMLNFKELELEYDVGDAPRGRRDGVRERFGLHPDRFAAGAADQRGALFRPSRDHQRPQCAGPREPGRFVGWDSGHLCPKHGIPIVSHHGAPRERGSFGDRAAGHLDAPPGETAAFPVSLSVPAPANGVFITLSSGDPARVAVGPARVFIPAGATTSTQPALTGIGLTGTPRQPTWTG